MVLQGQEDGEGGERTELRWDEAGDLVGDQLGLGERGDVGEQRRYLARDVIFEQTNAGKFSHVRQFLEGKILEKKKKKLENKIHGILSF